MQFTSVDVVKTKENFYYIEWGFAPTTTTPVPTTEAPTTPEPLVTTTPEPHHPGGLPTTTTMPPLFDTTTTPAPESPSTSPSSSASSSASPSPPPESVDDYNFQIWWSRDPISGFLAVQDVNGDPIVIDGAVGPLCYTHQIRQYDFNQDNYYKILAIKKVELTQFFSETVFIGMFSDGIHEVMKYNEELLYQHYQGEPCLIIKRKSFGARCPVCWSKERQQMIRSHCDTCKGTGFVTGYYQAIREQVSFDSDPKKSDSQKEWENVYDTIRARLSNYPLVRPKDLIVNLDNNKRFVITHVETTKLPKLSESKQVLSKQNYILSQLLTLEELNPDDNEYFIDVDHIPEVPQGDEGGTGSTIPFFNDHLPVTVDPPLSITDNHQHVVLNYSSDDFKLINGILALKNSTGSIGTESYIAAEVIAPALKVVITNGDGTISIADSSDKTQVDKVVGITLSEAAMGGLVVVQKLGKLVNVSWNWTIGKGIFFDDNGNLTQTVPVGGYWMNIAKVITPTIIEILLRLPVIRV